jgi:hypothetical protein
MATRMIKKYNPLKSHEAGEIHEVLSNIITQTGREFVFYNDNVGYYFSPLRSHNVSLWLDNPKYYNLFVLLQDDIFMTKTVFRELIKGFHWELIDYFEENSKSESNPIILSFMLFCLHNLSDADDDSFSMYSENNVSKLKSSIEMLDSFYIKDNEILLDKPDKSKFIVSVEKDFDDNEGLLITKKKRKDFELVKRVGMNNIYYVPKRY